MKKIHSYNSIGSNKVELLHFFFVLLMFLILSIFIPLKTFASVWYESTSVGSLDWQAVASSADDSKLFAGIDGGYLLHIYL